MSRSFSGSHCGGCGLEIFGLPAKDPATDVPMHATCITVRCETCGTQTRMTGTKRCDGCWEVEHRLAGYLQTGGGKALKNLVRAIADHLGIAVQIVPARTGKATR